MTSENNSISIRKATLADIPLINEMADAAFRTTYKDILSADQIDYMMEWMYSIPSLKHQMAEEGHIYFISECYEGEFDGNPVPCGYVSVQKDDSTEQADNDERAVYHLQKIYVLPDYQGRGIGEKLFNKIVDFVKEMNPYPCRIELNVNRNNSALHFYEKMGMKKLREGDFPIGKGYYMNDYIMGLDLD